MKTSSTLLLCLLALLLSSAFCSNAGNPTNCCFRNYPSKIAKGKIQKYIQTEERCAKAGVIFVTLKNKKICVDPNMTWVQNIMRDLDEKQLE
ncbi:C-C motif chemokine 36.1 [Eucyclogobius newberryi]|uniref:C-C motif chemokine 36.1 n=1 Tax=Eucyclogobius newberryi TaxID=166745 RepID=UPI003B5C1FEA